LSINRADTSRKVKGELRKYNIAIEALQEIRWKGKGMMKSEDFIIFYSGAQENMFGTGFIVQKNYKHLIMDFKAVNDRISMLRVGGNSLTLRCLACMPRLKKKKKKSRMHSMI
jgi:hypothetical protein